MTLKSCSSIVGVDVMSFETERDVLVAWRVSTSSTIFFNYCVKELFCTKLCYFSVVYILKISRSSLFTSKHLYWFGGIFDYYVGTCNWFKLSSLSEEGKFWILDKPWKIEITQCTASYMFWKKFLMMSLLCLKVIDQVFLSDISCLLLFLVMSLFSPKYILLFVSQWVTL